MILNEDYLKIIEQLDLQKYQNKMIRICLKKLMRKIKK